MSFEFATASKIRFGAGLARHLPDECKGLGKRPLVVTGRNRDRIASSIRALRASGFESTVVGIETEPTVPLIESAASTAKGANCDMVIAIGGGSVVDAGKAVAGLLTNRGSIMEYLEVIGKGRQLSSPGAPFIAVPTTAGTGAEVTKNAVLGSPKHGVKVSFRSPYLYAKVALVDPELTYSMPPQITAASGLDALTQLIEPYVSRRATPLTDSICRDGIKLVARSLEPAFEKPGLGEARSDMALASLFGGLALANAGLGAVHGFAGPLGGLLGAPHGQICARLLPVVVDANISEIGAHKDSGQILGRYEEIGQLLTGTATASAKDGVDWLHGICERLCVPPLSELGMTHDHIDETIEKAKSASSMKGNPVELSNERLRKILSDSI